MKAKANDRDSRTGHFLKGNKAALKHGAYSLARAKKVPSFRGVRALVRHLDQVKVNLEKATPELNVKKEILIGQVVKTEEKLCLMDMWIRKTGILRPDRARRGLLELQPCLAYSYLGFMNSQRLALMALGLDTEEAEKVLTPIEYIKKFDKAKAKKKVEK